MTKASNYPVILLLKVILIIIFANLYSNIYRETKSSFYQENNDRKACADSAELLLKMTNEIKILESYENYKAILKVQKSVTDNIYNKLKNRNTNTFEQTILERPEHRATAFINQLQNDQCYGDTIAKIIDSVNNKIFYAIFREVRHTYSLSYKYPKRTFKQLEVAIKNTVAAIDHDRDLCNRVIKNAKKDINAAKNKLNNTHHKLDANLIDFIIFSATIEFTFNYTDISPSSSKVLLICLLHKIIAGILYFILMNQLKKKFFP